MMTERLSDAAVMYTERPWGQLVMTHRVSKSAQQPLVTVTKGSPRDAWSDTKTFMHDKQHVSTTQQLHRHQWTTDLSSLKGRGGSIGAFLLWIMRIKCYYTAGYLCHRLWLSLCLFNLSQTYTVENQEFIIATRRLVGFVKGCRD